MHIHCCQCGEAYTVQYIRSYDMGYTETEWFTQGKGCPACKWGDLPPKSEEMQHLAEMSEGIRQAAKHDLDAWAGLIDDFIGAGL